MLNIVTDVDFPNMRKNAACYVDKTWFIEEFLKNLNFRKFSTYQGA